MTEAVIVSAVRTPIGTARKGALANTTALELAHEVVGETLRRSTVDPGRVEDIIFAESGWGGGDIARHAAVTNGMPRVPGQAINRHCAGSLASVGNAAAAIRADMNDVVIAGGVQSTSTAPTMRWRVPGTADEYVDNWLSPTHPDSTEAPNRDMSITVGWNTARAADIDREAMDRWALRSHQRAVAAIDAGLFDDEIVAVKALQLDGSYRDFGVDEHPRRSSTYEKLASLAPLHPEIDGFSITAGNASGVNDAAAALTLANAELAEAEGWPVLARIRSWAAVGIEPALMGLGVVDVVPLALRKAGVELDDVAVWEINEAFASVPIAACRRLGIDEDKVNMLGSGCSLGHPVAASGARMLTTLTHQLRRSGGGVGVAAMCAGGGQAGAVVLEVF
ncbi:MULTISPECIES: thiolase family protein [Gordonia]|uniref:thiolase family protein n=1 Tax=Gordonia TaxID=2053 RepID=UPI0004B2A03C|nr:MULTISPECIES: thiolase family protein [Gordonia]MDH3008767.1 thiolase family protein [Gordonia alkanivorans]MDH3012618.1 thiolase family protein [Gordonia alkanivorans]MDH3017664.1 thiolase family protein [Gordonia alkanivorans]MDH3022014.1 thiolase family protein [Gordonia alkanivorans]MDH3025942.1 thiolase family protein [Gordonia alkanivorans]